MHGQIYCSKIIFFCFFLPSAIVKSELVAANQQQAFGIVVLLVVLVISPLIIFLVRWFLRSFFIFVSVWWVIWFTDDDNYFIALDSFSFQERHRHHPSLLSVALSKGKITKNKLSCELPHLSERVLAIDIIPEPIDVFWNQLLAPGARAEDGEKESWRSHLPDAPTHCGSGSNQCQFTSNHIELSGLPENEKPDGAPIWIGHNLFLVRSIPWKDNRTYRKLFNHLDFISVTLSVSWWPWRRLCPQRWLFPHICSKV